MSETIEFTKESIKDYFDSLIRYWRKRKIEYADASNLNMMNFCACYIDAFQSARASIFGGLLPEDEDNGA